MQQPINWSGGGLKTLTSKDQQSSFAKRIQKEISSDIVLSRGNHEKAKQSNCDSSIQRSPSHLRGFLSRSTLVGIIVLFLTVITNGQLTCTGTNVDRTAKLLWKGECICIAGYIWNPSTGLCDPCSNYQYTVAGSTQGSCKCSGTRIWRGSSRTCIIPSAVDCTASLNNGETSPVQVPKACNCISKF